MESLFNTLQEISPYVLFSALTLVGAVREWWVWGHVYRRERSEKEYWRAKALDHLGMAEEALQVAKDEMIGEAK